MSVQRPSNNTYTLTPIINYILFVTVLYNIDITNSEYSKLVNHIKQFLVLQYCIKIRIYLWRRCHQASLVKRLRFNRASEWDYKVC